MFSVDLVGGSGAVTTIAPGPLPRPPTALAFNWSTNEVYVAGHDGAITVYRRA